MMRTERIASVDVLRGVVMIIMALDHTREFVHAGAMVFQPEDLARTTPILFFTRWITHFCAPVFMFTAGMGAFFRLERGGTRADLSRFLWTRGLWLVLLEITVSRFAFFFTWSFNPTFLLVFWALGISMIALAALVHLPSRVLAVVSVAVILLHNLAAPLGPDRLAALGILGKLAIALHQPGLLWTNPVVISAYPLIPWIFVMAAGFCFGAVYRLPAAPRRRLLIRLGLLLTAAFFVIRLANVYGDPRPWAAQTREGFTALSVLAVTKYPPSLSFLLMTLGPAVLLLGLIDGIRPGARHPALIFGRTPLFYYLLHLFVIHLAAIALGWWTYGRQSFLLLPPPTLGTPLDQFPAGYGWSLGVTYGVWIAVVVAMYPLCRWFANLKAVRPRWWLSYL